MICKYSSLYFESLLSAAEIAGMNTDIRFTYNRC